jgi:hypothetical protein
LTRGYACVIFVVKLFIKKQGGRYRFMKRWIVVLFLVVALPALAWAQAPSNEELYQMIKQMEHKLDTAIDEANKARAEADKAKEEAAKAKEEAAKAKEELARIKEAPVATPAAVPKESLVRVPETRPGLGASAEAVYLRPSRSNLDYVLVDRNDNGRPQGKLDEVEPGYGWGGRFGVSYGFGSGTDIGAQFMWIRTHNSESAARPPGGALWATWLHPGMSMIGDDDATFARASYNFEHYVIDLGVGQELDIGKHFGLRIDAGLRYANMAQDFDIGYWEVVTVPAVNDRRTMIFTENDFQGWGGRVGLGLDWRVGWGFNVFSSVAGSVLVGDFDMDLMELGWRVGQVDPARLADVDETIRTRVIPVIETQVGIGYTYRLKNGWSIGARAGYEWQNWFNMVTVKRFTDDVDPQLFYTDTTDIGLDGFFFKAFMTFR